MIRGQKRLVEYENGHRAIWTGRAEIHYHKTRIIRTVDITHAAHEEIEHLRKNPHNEQLLSAIQKRKNIVR